MSTTLSLQRVLMTQVEYNAFVSANPGYIIPAHYSIFITDAAVGAVNLIQGNGTTSPTTSSGGSPAGGVSHKNWTANTYYDVNTVVLATVAVGTFAIGDPIRRQSSGTSGATLNATEAASWTELPEDPDFISHRDSVSNPHAVTKAQVGLGNADNTADTAKPVSTAQQTALNTKATKTIIRDRDTVTNGLTGRLGHLRSDALTAGALAAWNDESGIGNNFAAVGTAQPVVTASAIGTHSAVRFDGVNDVASRLSIDIGASWTIAALVRTGASLSGQILSDAYPSAISYMLGLNTASFLGGTAGAICVGTFNGAWSGAVAPTIAAVNTTYLITATRTQGGNFVLRVNGVQVATAAAGGAPTFEPTGNLYIGKRWDNAASEFWNGDIGEVQLFNRVLTADELQVTEGMLAWKYGHQAALPTTHSYASDAPAIIDAPVTGMPAVNNTLTSTSITEALAAAQGKTLKDTADTLATTVAGKANTSHTHVKADVGLANVDNTADTAKPVSTAQQTALDLKQTRIVYTTAQDANNLVASGVHVSGNGAGALTNGPSGAAAWEVRVAAMTTSGGTYIHQLYATDNNDMYTRKRDNGSTWSTWTKVLNGSVAQSEVTNLTTDLAAKEATANKGVANGYAELDAGGRVPQAQLPTLPFGFELIDPMGIIAPASLAMFLHGDTLTAGAVATWANPGTGGDFTQATGGSQPTAELVPTLGGRMAAKFDGVDDWMSALSISLGTRYGLFAVIRTGGAITANGHLLSKVYPDHVDYSLNAGSNFEGDGAGTGFAVGHFNGAWRGYGNGTVPVVNTPYILAGMYDGTNFSLSINGATATTQAETSNPVATQTTATMLGRRWDNTVAAANIWNGHIAALVCKSGAAFTADELAKLQGWAAWYYGMASSLPAGHAYKNFPPLIAA